MEMLATVPPREPLREANDDTEDDETSAKWRSHRRVIGGVAEYQGRDAEEYIDYQGRHEGVTGDEAEKVINHVEEVADGPEK
jgi:hypothetical protein